MKRTPMQRLLDRLPFRIRPRELVVMAFPFALAGLLAWFVMEDPGEDAAPVPVAALSAVDVADRVHYASGGTREWGTFCRLERGWVSVEHVTRNGTPVVGPTAPVVAFDEASDWSLLGIDPMEIDLASIPALVPGPDVQIAGFPARDLDGEVLPGRVYIDDTVPPFMWVELLPLPDGGPPEGVVGGQSGSCVLIDGDVAGVVSANGFSRIDGTTNTWALVVPLDYIIRAARGEQPEPRMKPTSFLPDTRPRPEIAIGRAGLRPE